MYFLRGVNFCTLFKLDLIVQNLFLEIPVTPRASDFDDGYDVKLWVRNVVLNNWNWKISQLITCKWTVFACHLRSQGLRWSRGSVPAEAVRFLRVNKNPQHVGGHGC